MSDKMLVTQALDERDLLVIAPPTRWHIKSALMLAAVTIFGQKRSESLFWKPSEQPAPLPSPIRMSL